MKEQIIKKIYNQLYKKDVDKTLNIFLCGADTGNTDSFRHLLNIEFKKYAKFNVVYPEFIFATLLNKKDSNLLELEDELAKYVDLIIIPLEGQGTLAEIGAFTVNKKLLPKILAINDIRYKNAKSFINLGPIDLIKKQNSNHLFYYKKGKEKDIFPKLLGEINTKKIDKRFAYELENIFNLSRYIFYLISVFQPLTKKEIINHLNRLTEQIKDEKIKLKFIDASIQILVQKNRVEKDFDPNFVEIYTLSDEGHKYVYEELLPKLQIVNEFSDIRLNILRNRIKKDKKNMGKEIELLELE
ncbi:retron St85 family effector protein [Salegentibacter maritimus]|uniref:retron St85 family effector protein n=1 Tax=Salegentibacter maritimus TaxID=2794347 RepID=UPI0018E42CB1|nr:retron St85 family effector protein [Salegentibacter maritimus]MBI6116663.1 retron St85 family effector protein [Salegentibacter maritimus]